MAGSRTIQTSDPLDIRKWLGEYEESNYGTLYRARALYQYDSFDGTSQFGRGRRTAVWDGSGHASTYYDQAGRAYKKDRTVDGTLYTSQWTFDALSRIYQATLPDSEVISYFYGAHGLLIQMTSSLRVDYVSGVGYNVLGQPRQYTLGSGTTATASLRYYGLDVSGYPFGALETIQLQQGSSPMLVDREMTYDPVGNVTAVNDRVSGENVSYSYDDLDRLTSAGSPLSEAYTYSETGNLTSKNGGALSYTDPAHIHAVTSFNGTSYSYDPNGSMVLRGTGTIRYDAERRPARVNDGASVLWRAAYDGDGGRRKRVDAKGTIHYLGGYERNVGNGMDTTETVTKYYRALGRLIAFRRNGVFYWVGTDHLGGTVAVAGSSFGPIAAMRYTPYGVSRDNTDDPLTDSLFTGQKLDASIGLYWYGSRAYDQSLGRFTCPDSVVPSPGNPQSLNRFSYAANNPMRYADPSGHNPYDGQGIVVYDNPSYLPVEQRQALYEHNSDPSVSNGSQGTVRVHESGGGGGGGGADPSGGLVAWDGQTLASQRTDVQNLFNNTWHADAASQWVQEHNAAIIQPYKTGTIGTEDERTKLAAALVELASSHSDAGARTSQYFQNGQCTVQFGGGSGRQENTSMGWDKAVYLAPELESQGPEIIAANIAHEAYHAEQSVPRYPWTRSEEVQAFTVEAEVWDSLRVSYHGPNGKGYDEIWLAWKAHGLKEYVESQPIYWGPFHVPPHPIPPYMP